MPCSGAPFATFAGSAGPALPFCASFSDPLVLVSGHVVTGMDVSLDFSSPHVTEAIVFFHVVTSRQVASRSGFSVSGIVIQKGHRDHFLQRDWLSLWQGPGSPQGGLAGQCHRCTGEGTWRLHSKCRRRITGFVTDPADLKGAPQVDNRAGQRPSCLLMSHATRGVLVDALCLPLLLHWEASYWQLSGWVREEAAHKRSEWSQRQCKCTALTPLSVLEDALRQMIDSAQPPGPSVKGVRDLGQDN